MPAKTLTSAASTSKIHYAGEDEEKVQPRPIRNLAKREDDKEQSKTIETVQTYGGIKTVSSPVRTTYSNNNNSTAQNPSSHNGLAASL